MLTFHSCCIYGTRKSKEVGSLSHHMEGTGQATRMGEDFYRERAHKKLPGEINPQLVYLNYIPISVFFGVKRYSTT